MHIHLDHVFLVSLIYYDTLVRNQGIIVNALHFYSRLCIIFDIFVKQLMSPTIYLGNHCKILWTINRKLLIMDVANMPRNNAQVDPCFKKAVEFLLKHPTIKIPDTMKLTDFSPQEQEWHAKGMMIYCKLDKVRKTQQSNGDAFLTPPPPPQSVAISSDSDDCGVLSSMTLSSSSSPAPPDVPKKARSTITAVQLCHAEAVQKKKVHNAAFKSVAVIYNHERKVCQHGLSWSWYELTVMCNSVQERFNRKLRKEKLAVLCWGKVQRGIYQSFTTRICAWHLSRSYASIN